MFLTILSPVAFFCKAPAGNIPPSEHSLKISAQIHSDIDQNQQGTQFSMDLRTSKLARLGRVETTMFCCCPHVTHFIKFRLYHNNVTFDNDLEKALKSSENTKMELDK